MINNRQYAGRRFNKSVSLRSWVPVYDSATQDVTSPLLLPALYYQSSLFLPLPPFTSISFRPLVSSPAILRAPAPVSSFPLHLRSLFVPPSLRLLSREFIIYQAEGGLCLRHILTSVHSLRRGETFQKALSSHGSLFTFIIYASTFFSRISYRCFVSLI